MNDEPILALGLNPAYQKSLLFDKLTFNEVNRAKGIEVIPGGKGANFARAAKNWGGRPVRLFQFAGGGTGEEIVAILDAEGLEHHTVFVKEATRVCTTCLCETTREMTELIEPSGRIPPDAVETLKNDILKALPDCAGVALCGTFPPGVTGSFYADVAAASRRRATPTLLDAFKEIDEVLKVGVTILKINAHELAKLTGQTDVEIGAKEFLKGNDVEVLAITDGGGRALLATGEDAWRFTLPIVDPIVNPLGAGDTVSAVFLSEFLRSNDLPASFAMGLAAGSASCRSVYCGEFKRSEAEALFDEIAVEKVSVKLKVPRSDLVSSAIKNQYSTNSTYLKC